MINSSQLTHTIFFQSGHKKIHIRLCDFPLFSISKHCNLSQSGRTFTLIFNHVTSRTVLGELAHDGIFVRQVGSKVLSKTIYMQLCELVKYVIIMLYKYFMLLKKLRFSFELKSVFTKKGLRSQ